MSDSGRDIFSPRLILGLAIIVIGAIALLANLGYNVDIHFWDYWPVILILIGLSMLLKRPEQRNNLAGWIFLALGALFLLNNFDIIDFGVNLLWPILIILAGLAILRHGFKGSDATDESGDTFDISAVLGGGEHNCTSKTLRGGKVFALMGGSKIDMREAEMAESSATIDVFALMGGVELLVPTNWQVSIHGSPLLGGMDNKTTLKDVEPGGAKQLIVKGTAIMGGIEVKN